MKYELAKELKDAGFPQYFKDGRPAAVKVGNSDYAYDATLSELIEACGDEFDVLHPLRLAGKIKSWSASAFSIPLYFSAPTAEEAVARLWLALNKVHVGKN